MIRDLTNRFGPLPIALAGGLILGLLTLTIPNHLIEGAVSTSGISELVSAAAPPLGVKARIAIALATALLVFGVLALILVRENDNMRFEYSENDWDDEGGFADLDRQEPTPKKQGLAERLKGFLPVFGDASADDVRELEDLPKLRREDRHPDAPPRAPLLAGRDLSESEDQQVSKPVTAQKPSGNDQGTVANVRKRISSLIPRDIIGDTTQNLDEIPLVVKKNPKNQHNTDSGAAASAPPQAPPQVPIEQEQAIAQNEGFMDKVNAPQQVSQMAQQVIGETPVVSQNTNPETSSEDGDKVNNKDIPAPRSPVSPVYHADDERELADLSLSELIARLEQGIERLTVAAAAPSAAPVNPVSEDPEREAQSKVQQADTPVEDIAEPIDQYASDDQAPAPASEQPIQKTAIVSDGQPITDPDDMDEALRAALETLRQMTGQQRNAS